MTENSPAAYAIVASAKEAKGDRYFFATLVRRSDTGATYLLLTSSSEDHPGAFHDLDCLSRFPDDMHGKLVGALKTQGHTKYMFPDNTAMARELACAVYNARPPRVPGQRHMSARSQTVANPALAG